MAVILLYHAIADEVTDPALQVRPETLHRHLAWCRELGHGPAPLADVLAHSAEPLGGVTFDDGLASIAVMLRALLGRRIVPTVFLCPGRIGGENAWASPGRVRERLLDLGEVRQFRSEGVDFAPHGWDHRSFVGRSPASVAEDFSSCRQWFRSNLAIDPEVFAWPFGRYDEVALSAVGRDYRHALAVDPPWGADVTSVTIPRLLATEGMAFEAFAEALELASFTLGPSALRSL